MKVFYHNDMDGKCAAHIVSAEHGNVHLHTHFMAMQYGMEFPFEAVVPDADIWMPFRYVKDGYWKVSLYSTEVDVSEIAKQYEFHGKVGGGHTNASGFECAYPPFLPKA